MTIRKCITALMTALLPAVMTAESAGDTVRWSGRLLGGGSTGEFAPYLIGANSGGRHTMKSAFGAEVEIVKELNLDRRFSWSAGIDVSAIRQPAAEYMLYDEGVMTDRPWHPARVRLQQLWGIVKWRSVYFKAGMSDHRSPIVDDRLSSGDLTLSDNARGVPVVEVGLTGFRDIPLTRCWVQIDASIAYGKYTDNGALKGRFNYYDGHIVLGQLYTYKRIHFRTRTDRPLSVMIGVQAAGAFGGITYFYSRGKEDLVQKNPSGLKAAWQMLFPVRGDNSDGYYEGNHLGTWDFKGRYRLKSGVDLEGYFQWLWEDGSSMGRRNMTDGLWGIGLTLPGKSPVLKKIIAEYIDFRDQSGALHWSPNDAPGTTITTEATGGDNYYNNSTFNSWANYGMGQGSSFPVSPLYNTDGSLKFRRNRTRGVHVAATGFVSDKFGWTVKFSHGVAWGDGRRPDPRALKNTSASFGGVWDASGLVRGLSVSGIVAFDAGKLRGDNFGALVSVAYSGNFSFNNPSKTF
ncbi:MAG: capsule assembly Wzi family protein [Muribaculaceae bacterium]|nr:capsule assembly Wzi family protein [Muribaculaceae bacterium]